MSPQPIRVICGDGSDFPYPMLLLTGPSLALLLTLVACVWWSLVPVVALVAVVVSGFIWGCLFWLLADWLRRRLVDPADF